MKYSDLDDADRISAEGGVMEAFVAARQAGKIRYIGCTGHKDPRVHLLPINRGLRMYQIFRFRSLGSCKLTPQGNPRALDEMIQ
jgi:hypothetical protein